MAWQQLTIVQEQTMDKEKDYDQQNQASGQYSPLALVEYPGAATWLIFI
jgi:hypothetical protein